MAGSLITKKKIAKVFKKLVVDTGFDKVSISEIMKATDMRRQTYYDHFQDKYELIDWIFQQEAIEKIEDNLAYESWQKILEDLFVYFEENQAFYRNILSFEGQNSFQEYYTQHMKKLIHQMLEKKLTHLMISEEEQLFLEDFYANAYMVMTTKWILGGCQIKSCDFARQMQLALLITKGAI